MSIENENIYALHALKLLELGYSPIPVRYKRKQSDLFTGWQQYCKKAPKEQQVEEWMELFKKTNIGLCMGYNDIVAIDVDLDDERIISIMPRSPVTKRGAKGVCSLYRCSDEIKNQAKIWGEIKTTGSQIVIPPSIHPDTGAPYEWIGPFADLPHIDEIPYIDVIEIQAFAKAASAISDEDMYLTKGAKADVIKIYTESMNLQEGVHQRHIYLRNMSYAMACAGESVEDIASHLLEVASGELSSIKGNYYETDKPSSCATPEEFAYKDAKRAVDSAIKYNTRGQKPQMIIGTEENTISIPEPDIKKTTPYKTITSGNESLTLQNIKLKPATFGNLAHLVPKGGVMEYIFGQSLKPSDPSHPLALGTAISAACSLAANKYCIPMFTRNGDKVMVSHRIGSTTYIGIIAESGKGKTTSQNTIKKLLTSPGVVGTVEGADRLRQLVGSSRVLSANAIIKSIESKHLNKTLMLLDEIAHLWAGSQNTRAATSGTDDVFNMIYSSELNYYGGDMAKTKEAKVEGIYNPSVNILGSTTPAEFSRVVHPGFFLKGTMSRFLFFCDLQDQKASTFESLRDSFMGSVEPAFISEFDDSTTKPAFDFRSMVTISNDDSSFPHLKNCLEDASNLPESDLSNLETGDFHVEPVTLSEGAVRALYDLETIMQKFIAHLVDVYTHTKDVEDAYRASVMRALQNRTQEMVLKLCLGFAMDQRCLGGGITREIVGWAIKVYEVHLNSYWYLVEECINAHSNTLASVVGMDGAQVTGFAKERIEIGESIMKALKAKASSHKKDTQLPLWPCWNTWGFRKKIVYPEFKKWAAENLVDKHNDTGWIFMLAQPETGGNPQPMLVRI